MTDLIGQTGLYVPSWIRQFYASLFVDLHHNFIHFAFRGRDYRLTSQRVREILMLQEQPVKLHEVYYGQTEPPRRPHGGLVPPIDLVRHYFKEPFGEGSRRNPSDLTLTAQVLEAIMRRTLLPRMGYREGLTRIQLWLLNALMQQTVFDIWDLLLSEMEDTIAEGFKGHRQLPYAHWITFIILKAVTVRSPEMVAEYRGATTEFPAYNMAQRIRHSTP